MKDEDEDDSTRVETVLEVRNEESRVDERMGEKCCGSGEELEADWD